MTLAALLEADGLPKGHRQIQLVQCFGAGLSDEQYQTVQPYAERLASVMNARGYKKLAVAAVAGLVFGSTLAVGHRIDTEATEFDERIMVRTASSSLDEFALCLKYFGRGAPRARR